MIFNPFRPRQMRPPATDASGRIYADITNRLFASTLDLAIIYIFVDFFTRLIFNIYYPEGSAYTLYSSQIITEYPELQQHPDRIFAIIISKYPAASVQIFNQMFFLATVQFVLVGLYVVPLVKIYGTTLGKKIIGLKVADNITGKGITWSQSVIRFIGYLPSVFVFFMGFITASASAKKRTWHDFLADTIVVYDENRWYKRQTDKLKKFFNLK